MVRIQEERFLFSGASHFWHCLLQTNQYTVLRVGWKCADHRHGFFLRTIALRDFLLNFPALFSVCLSPFYHQGHKCHTTL